MTEIKDPFTAYEDVECRDGITRRIYPAKLNIKIKSENLRRCLTTLPLSTIFSALIPLLKTGGVDYTDTAWNAMLDILVLAFDEKYKREQIEEFLDLALARQVFTVFYDISSLKKKESGRRRRRNRMESAVRLHHSKHVHDDARCDGAVDTAAGICFNGLQEE